MKNASQRVLFVVNQGSGRKRNIDWKQIITGFMEKRSEQADYFMMPVEDCVNRLRVKIRNSRPDLVVAVGGDGTVTLVAGEVIDTGIPMAIVPAGSANGMAKELGIEEDPEKALAHVFSGEVRAVDTIRINEKQLCLHLSDLGLNAQLVKYFQDGNIRGKIGYTIALIKALQNRKRMTVRIRTRTEEAVRTAVMVIIGNASRYGTGAKINPDGSIYDGIFEVVVVRRLNVLEIFKMFRKFTRFDPGKIEVFEATSVQIDTSRKMHFQVDGEYLGKVRKVQANVIAAKLNLVVPKTQETQ